MKRLFIIDLLWIGLVVLAGLTWSVHDQSAYADRLNHFGLSESAVVLHTKSQMTPAQAVSKLADAKLDDLQVQFQGSDQTIYYYGSGDAAKLPLRSGAWFSDADLTSSLPVAVVGNELSDQLYAGSNQRYVTQNDRYIPVLGVVGTQKGSPLNDVTFLNASAATDAPALKQLTVIADGTNIEQDASQLKSLLHASSTSHYVYTGSQSRTWWQEKGQTFAILAVLLVVALGLGIFASRLVPMNQALGLTPVMVATYIRGWWGRAVAHNVVAGAIGVAIAWWAFYLTDHAYLLIYAILLLAVFAAGDYLSLRARFNRERNEQ
ncbi:ABC transporter permease [Lacticaseibacillus porcinae]|uniref:ABC transporter permease n=1 Tax=Lacticaseibacillus porcinae TaxID=1123687 RepID=UPI000F7AC46E|nr:ABC transporter permease [Lacticaseibacillus porcinae]